MKFGIRVTYKDGAIKYVTSTRHRPSISEDITNIALFVQQKSAVEAVKTLRKDGQEPEGAEFDVVGVQLIVANIAKVPRPTAKAGFIISSGKQFYTGTKKPGSSYLQYRCFGNVERATVFQTEGSAKARLTQILNDAEGELAAVKSEEPRNYHMNADERKKYHQELISWAQERVDVVKKAKVEKYE